MGEARRRSEQGLSPRARKNQLDHGLNSNKIISWFPVTREQRDKFISLTIKGGWVGVFLLILLWLVVRVIGPAAGWWVPADLK